MRVRVREVLAGLVVSLAAASPLGPRRHSGAARQAPASRPAPQAADPLQPQDPCRRLQDRLPVLPRRRPALELRGAAVRQALHGLSPDRRLEGRGAPEGGREAPGLHWKDGRPIEWVRIHKVAGFVYFPHKRHVQTGSGLPAVPRRGPGHDRGRPGGAPDHGLVRVLPRRAEGSARLRGLPPLTERHGMDEHRTSGARARRGPPGLLPDRRRQRRGRGGGRRLRQDDRVDPALRHPARAHRAGRGDLVRHRVPRVPGRLRGAREEPRGAGREAGGESRPPGQPGRPLRARPGESPRDLRSGPHPGPARSARARPWRPVSVADAQKLLVEKLAAARQAGPGRIAMLTQLETGSLGRLMDEWLKAVGGRARVAYEPFAHEDLRAASRAVFGVDAIPHHAFEDARTILSLGADFLETWISPVEYAGAFRRAHALRDGHAAHVIHVEPRYSMTAANADEWIPSAAGQRGGDRARAPAARARRAPGPGLAGQGGGGPRRGRPRRSTWRRWPSRAASPRPRSGGWPRPW